MAGRKVVVKDNLVQSVQSNSVSVHRNGAIFRLKIKAEDGSVQMERSMYLDRLLASLENRQLAESMILAFALGGPTPGELKAIFPKFNLEFQVKGRNS
ncbi:MAG: hypothetical protein Q8O32_03120 [bacterium]|nr:hypothetical protein [bacterium]